MVDWYEVRTIEQTQTHANPEMPAGFLLSRLGAAANDLYRESFKGTGLKPPHVAVLTALRFEPVSQQALSDATDIDAVKLVGVLNDLETAGLLERRRDTIDRRRHIVDITGQGRDRLAAVERAAQSVEDRLFSGLDSAQRAQLVALLRRVMETSQVGFGCPELDAHPACPESESSLPCSGAGEPET